jgi:hypothetical protein
MGIVAWAIIQNFRARGKSEPQQRQDPSHTGNGVPSPRRVLTQAQQVCLAELQAALSSTLILVQPRLDQILNPAPVHLASRTLDFAVCSKDSTPIAVVMLDSDDRAIEEAIANAGLRFANFHSHRLPDAQTMRATLGFL